MFIGRERELQTLRRLYEKNSFQMAVVYGRRRVGKTALLTEFCKGKHALFFTAQQKNNVANLRAFSQELYRFLGLPENAPSFGAWDDALRYLAQACAASGEKAVLVFDEFPYAAQAEPSLPSVFQIAIDHQLKSTNLLLILCGSNEGFMESEVLGAKSPLYGRRSAQIRLTPFDYRDAARFIPQAEPQEQVIYYSAFGGTPYYLEQIDPSLTFSQNVEALFFDMSGTLYAEPQMLLRQELREPATYTSVLDAIGSGATVPKRIAERAGVDEAAVGSYLAALVRLGIVQREVPLGDNPDRSRKGLYTIRDPFFSFWYRFVSPNINLVEQGMGSVAAGMATDGPRLSEYVGHQFEGICLQWVIRQARAGALPFVPTAFGRWWGTDPTARERVDIDVLATCPSDRALLAGECKWRDSFNETEAIETLAHRAAILDGFSQRWLMLFMKRQASSGTIEKVGKRADVQIVTVEQMYE